MPFVRDFAYSYSSATAATLVVPVPAYVQNDLLLAFISSDGSMAASTSAATATGWTHVGYWTTAGTNAAGMTVLCKFAGASETDTTFTIATETANGTIISLGDTFFDGGTGINAIGAKTASTNVSNWTAARAGYPALTTTVDNSIVMYFAVGGGTGASGVASILEGPAHSLIGKDGSAHTDGVAWGFKKTAGTISANTVYAQVSGTSSPSGFLAQMEIKQPSGGATVIPTYVVTDNCKLINIGTGAAHSTVYGNSTATTANAIFTIGTMTLNSRPIVAGGTTYTYTDQGINTYHSAIGILGVTTSNSWASNQTAHATMTDLANANILLHLSPQLPIDIQTTDSMSLAGACGLGVGLASSAGNAKAWHVHGAGTPWGASRYVPVVVNTGNTSGLLGSIGTLNTASITTLGLFLSSKTVAAKWTCKSVWKLDTTVVCGGNSANPLTALSLVGVVADAKERRSVISQGNGQLLSFQVLQVGDGGTNPTYLDFAEVAMEFPRQYSKSRKQINYCSVDNKCGVVFYPGASDTLDLRSAVFSSPNKYVFQFHASSGAATVLTDNMLVIGAGTISFANNINISNATFSGCDEITAATNTLTSVNFASSTSTVAAITITGTTQAELQTALNKLVSCRFTNNTTPAGALRIVYTGTAGAINLSMSSNSFSGNTKDISWQAPASSNLTLSLSGTASASTWVATNSNTVTITNTKALTLTGLVDGSDVVITSSDTTTALVDVDSNVGTTYAYNYNYAAGVYIDIKVLKAGYVPYIVYDYLLGAQDSSLPISQVSDRNYLP